MRRAVVVALALAAASPAGAEPIGALVGGGGLALSGGGPVARADAGAIVYVGRRPGVYVGASRVALDGGSGLVTAGLAYRAAAARPRLELVVLVDGGVAWPRAAVAGAGLLTFLWPTRWPVAVVASLRAHAIVPDAADARVAWTTGLGLAIAR